MKVILVGGGKVGKYLANMLISSGHDVIIIEYREDKYNKIKRMFPEEKMILGYGSDPAVLEKAGINKADVLAAVTDEDEINLVVTTLAKMEFGVPRVIARVNNPKNAWLYNSGMGVDAAVNQADLIAHLVLEEMELNNTLTLLSLNKGEYSIIQTKVSDTSEMINACLKDVNMPGNAKIISITRNDVIHIPNDETRIFADDDLIIFAAEENIKAIGEMFS